MGQPVEDAYYSSAEEDDAYDAELLHLGTEFNQANELWQAAKDRLVEAEGQGLPFKMLSEAEDEADQASQAVGAIARRIMDMRAGWNPAEAVRRRGVVHGRRQHG